MVQELIALHDDLHILATQQIEDKRVVAMSMENNGEQISRIKAVLERYGIDEPCSVFNIDESDCHFDRLATCERAEVSLKKQARRIAFAIPRENCSTSRLCRESPLRDDFISLSLFFQETNHITEHYIMEACKTYSLFTPISCGL